MINAYSLRFQSRKKAIDALQTSQSDEKKKEMNAFNGQSKERHD